MTRETVRNQLAGIYPFMIGKDFCKHKVIEETTGEKTDNIKTMEDFFIIFAPEYVLYNSHYTIAREHPFFKIKPLLLLVK